MCSDFRDYYCDYYEIFHLIKLFFKGTKEVSNRAKIRKNSWFLVLCLDFSLVTKLLCKLCYS